MTGQRFDCLCAGIVVADHVCDPIDHVPKSGELVLTDRMDLTTGGCAANVAIDLARLGMRTGVWGVVGRDVFGQSIRETLEQADVDCSHLTESDTRETSGTLVINTQGEDRRFIHSKGANAEFTAEDVSPEFISAARILYLGGFCLNPELSAENVARLFQAARNAGVTTVLDVVVPDAADYRASVEAVLPWTDLFLPNEDEARSITGITDPAEQAEAFASAGAKTVVVTCGTGGAILRSAEHRLRARAYPVEFKDGTGSGDAFAAGYLYGTLQGKDPQTCLRYGSALGASCVRAAGATTGVFDAKELAEYVDSQPLSIERF